MNVLVTGGAGYIGSFMTKRLLDEGHAVFVLDSLVRGHKDAIDTRATFLQCDLKEREALQAVLKGKNIDAVIHFAGYISMGESMKDPSLYFMNNTFATLNLLEAMRGENIKRIIFSSSAGVYGNPNKIPIPEDHIKNPTNPYGESKRMVERLLSWYFDIFGMSYIGLRYFNASGAALDGSLGERHIPDETHLIPCAINAALTNSPFRLFGTDYDTEDGTCVRDYIHILDLVEAHVLALGKISGEKTHSFYNVGTGKGYSNKQVIEMVKKVSKIDFSVVNQARRPGDANMLIADARRIKEDLKFEPKHSDLETIVKTAWTWHERLKMSAKGESTSGGKNEK